MIAPRGMNCRLCVAYAREKNPCPGCRGDDRGKPKTRVLCLIKTCDRIGKGGARDCSGCGRLSCDPLRRLNERNRRPGTG